MSVSAHCWRVLVEVVERYGVTDPTHAGVWATLELIMGLTHPQSGGPMCRA